MRQPCCRASRTPDPARGTPLPILVTGVLDGLPSPLGMRVSRGMACGSHAAAPDVLPIRRVVHC
ncbi:hypothetical protein [Chloroflexus sp.]|uniref:hypothetical protein n=1 Tax=Chloroflexus sp. TaxID=1904827 RepID=UPI002ADDE103|nr:hypothetical protein [Chloroflexus sp.]